MLDFLAGGIYTVIVLGTGIFLGVLFTSGKLEQKVEKAVRKIHQQRKLESGPVKVMTDEEKEQESRRPVASRIKELVS